MEIAVRHFRAAPSWKRIAVVAGVVAALELVLLIVGGISLIAKPVQSSVKRAALEQAQSGSARSTATARSAARHTVAAPRPAAVRPAVSRAASAAAATSHLPRARTSVLVLNGIGTSGAAGRAAERVRARGYRIGGVTNARRMDYTRTTIMYRPGFRAEGVRLGHDLRVPLVGPLDGMRPGDLGRAQLVVIVGA